MVSDLSNLASTVTCRLSRPAPNRVDKLIVQGALVCVMPLAIVSFLDLVASVVQGGTQLSILFLLQLF